MSNIIGIPERTLTFCGKELKRTFHFITLTENDKGRKYKVAICSNCGKKKNIVW